MRGGGGACMRGGGGCLCEGGRCLCSGMDSHPGGLTFQPQGIQERVLEGILWLLLCPHNYSLCKRSEITSALM